MSIFTNESLEQYEFLTQISFNYGLIDIFTLDERLEFINNDRFEDSVQELSEVNEFFEIINPIPHRIEFPTLSLMSTTKGSLGDFWGFTLGDPDHFPSIPHGHLKSNSKIKLDSFLGYTFDTSNNKQLKRESKEYIAKLWNSEKFRAFSLKQINWFINKNPSFKWRTNNPVRLPTRMRKNKRY